jgi:hypothetical protein
MVSGDIKMKALIITLVVIGTLFNSTVAMPKSESKIVFNHREVRAIAKMIKVIKPKINETKAMIIAHNLFNTSKKFNLDPKVMIAIIDTESDFDNSKISTTGDLSLAQINTTIWNKELARMKLPMINERRLQNDEKYALNQMAMILSILKNRHSQKDGIWYARYHSHTKKYKKQYYAKVETRMRKIASID